MRHHIQIAFFLNRYKFGLFAMPWIKLIGKCQKRAKFIISSWIMKQNVAKMALFRPHFYIFYVFSFSATFGQIQSVMFWSFFILCSKWSKKGKNICHLKSDYLEISKILAEILADHLLEGLFCRQKWRLWVRTWEITHTHLNICTSNIYKLNTNINNSLTYSLIPKKY